MMNLWTSIFLYLCSISVSYAAKEEVPFGSSHPDARHLLEMVKRLGREKGVNLDGLLRGDSDESCKTNTLTRDSIIKSKESIRYGAKFLRSQKGISSIDYCSSLCCDEEECDTAIYQDDPQKERSCYLFACHGKCVFKEHINYMVATVERLDVATQSKPEEEAQLEDLHDNANNDNVGGGEVVREPTAKAMAQPVTSPPTPPPKPYVAPHTAALSNFCTSDVSCEDPNAGCAKDICQCRQDFYNKDGLCRQACPSSHFECLKLGSLTRGPECVPLTQVCDGELQCADGSDEFDCKDLADNAPARSWNQQYQPPSSSWSNSADNAGYNNNNNNNGQSSFQGRQPIQPSSQPRPNPRPTAPNLGNNGQMSGNRQVQPGNERPPPMVPPTVRQNLVPSQHVTSSMGPAYNNRGGNNPQPLPPNPTNNVQPSRFPVQSNRNNPTVNANANPIVNPSPSLYNENDAPQRQSPRINPQASGNSPVNPSNLPNSNANGGPSPPRRVPQQPVAGQKPYPQPASPNRAYAEGGSLQGIPVSRNPGQRVQSQSAQKQAAYPQQSASRQGNGTASVSANGGMGSQRPGGGRQQSPAESHFLSKPSVPTAMSPSSSSSSSVQSQSKSQTGPERPNPHQVHQPISSANKVPVSSHAQTGRKPSHYKSASSSSSSSSYNSQSGQPDSPSWLDNDGYLPYGSSNGKLSPKPRQPSQGQYYGQASQYYRPYSSDSLSPSLMDNDRSRDDFSQFGGPYLEPQKSGSQRQYQMNGRNSGYLNYPDSSYNSQFSPQDRYNFGGDFSSSNYPDSEFYLPLRSQPVYRPDGLYDDNPPSGASQPDNMRKDNDEMPGSERRRPDVGDGPASSEHHLGVPPIEAPELPSGKIETTTLVTPVASKKPSPSPVTKAPAAADTSKVTVKVNQSQVVTPKPRPAPVANTKEEVYLSREKVIIASSTSEAEGPIIALTLGLAFTIILIGLLACRLRNMKQRLRKGRPLNSNEADYLINGMYL